MDDYWKNETRNYPILIRILHKDKKCFSDKEQECVYLGYHQLVKPLLDVEYEYTLSPKTVNTFTFFCREVFNTGWSDDGALPLAFEYKEIWDAFAELRSFLGSIDGISIERSSVARLVTFFERHYYCPPGYGGSISLKQYLHHAGFSKNAQKKLWAEKKIRFNGSEVYESKMMVSVGQDQVQVADNIIPWFSKNRVVVTKSWGW